MQSASAGPEADANGVWPLRVLGVDFTSAPSRRKPIVAAWGTLAGPGRVRLQRVVQCIDFDAFDLLLRTPGPWVGAFDFPFGLPRELVLAQGWPRTWQALIRHYASLPRTQLRERFRAFCAARPRGRKFAHRATDLCAGSSPSMKWVNPPVAWMLHAGAPRLLDAGVLIPGLGDGDPSRVALEGYPGALARAITRHSYKSDRRGARNAARREQRERIAAALSDGAVAGIVLQIDPQMRAAVIDDGSGDRLDAVLCMVQAAWAQARAHRRWGLPEVLDPLEGWIVTGLD